MSPKLTEILEIRGKFINTFWSWKVVVDAAVFGLENSSSLNTSCCWYSVGSSTSSFLTAWKVNALGTADGWDYVQYCLLKVTHKVIWYGCFYPTSCLDREWQKRAWSVFIFWYCFNPIRLSCFILCRYSLTTKTIHFFFSCVSYTIETSVNLQHMYTWCTMCSDVLSTLFGWKIVEARMDNVQNDLQ